MDLQPIGEMVLVEAVEQDKLLASGLFVVSDREPIKRGTVVAAGPGEISKTTGQRASLEVVEGDTVLFHNYSGSDITVDGKEYRLIREAEILAKEVD